jgi:hypothetical protein
VALCSVTEAEPVKLPPLGLIVGVATVVTDGGFTVRLKFVVLVTPPPVPVTVIVEVPVAVEPLVLIVSVDEQVKLQLAEEKEAAAPLGRPEVEKETA